MLQYGVSDSIAKHTKYIKSGSVKELSPPTFLNLLSSILFFHHKDPTSINSYSFCVKTDMGLNMIFAFSYRYAVKKKPSQKIEFNVFIIRRVCMN